MSNDTIFIHLKVGVLAANAQHFEALMAELVGRSEGEPGILVYEWYQTEDGSWHILERYADAKHGDTHVRGFAENYAGRFFELCNSCDATVSDNATPYIRGVLEGLSPLYISRKGGFNRF